MEERDRVAATCSAEPLSAKHPKIHRRVGHVTVKYKNFIVVWGGYEDEEKHNVHELFRMTHYHPSDEVLLFDIEYEIWHCVQTSGVPPPRLCGSTASVCGDSMLVFGGFLEQPMQDSSNVQSLYELNLRRMRWRQIWAAGTPPLPCDKLVSWGYKDAFYVFGGFGPWPENASHYRGLRLASLPGEERCWNSQLVRFTRRRGWQWPETGGERPGPRAAHAAALVGSRLYLFGGRMGRRLNDLHCLEMETMHWSKLEPPDESSPVPQGRSWHSLTPLPNDQLLLYGGFNDDNQPLADPWMFDIASRRWTPCGCSTTSPPVRMWHSAAPGAEGEVLVVGGLSSSIFSVQSLYANRVVFVRRTPKTLLRLCLDAVERHRVLLTPDVWLLPPPLVDRVVARLTAAGGRLLS